MPIPDNTQSIPAKPIVRSYPTPNLADRIYVESIDNRKGDFVLPEKGSVYAGREASKYEGFVFATAQPSDRFGWTDLYWLNERANQDDYNYTVDYPYTDKDYPAVTRTYVLLRTDLLPNSALEADPVVAAFAEPEANTVDPVFTDLQLTDHKQVRLEDPILDSLFVGVQRLYEKLPGPEIITYQENEFQQAVEIHSQESTATDGPEIEATTEIAKLERTGTAKAKTTKGDTEDVFDQYDEKVELMDSVWPYKFRVAIPLRTISQVVAGQVTTPVVLGPQDWVAEEKQLTLYKKLVLRGQRLLDGCIELIGQTLTRDQQLATVTETLCDGDQEIIPRATLIKADVETMGNGATIKTEVEVEEIFDTDTRSIEIPDVAPAWARALSPTTTTKLQTPEDSIADPDLGPGELRKSLQRVTEHIVETQITARDIESLPKSRVNRRLTTEFGGGEVEEEQILAEGEQDISEGGLLVLGSEMEELGDGTSVVKTATAVEEWPTLIETEFDSRFGLLVNVEKKVVIAGTAGEVGDLAVTEVKALDKWRSIRIVGSLNDLPEDQIWFGTRNHSFPDELLDFALVGSEEMSVEFNIRDGYSGPCRARFTRKFTQGPPTDEPEPTIFLPQAFYKYVEYSSSRISTNISSSTSTGTSEHSSTNQSTNQSSGSHSSTSSSQTDSTSTGTSAHTDTSTSDGTERGSSSSDTTSDGTQSSTSNTNSTGSGTQTSHSDFNSYSETQTGGDTNEEVVSSFIISSSVGNNDVTGNNSGTNTNQSSNTGTNQNTSHNTSDHTSNSQSTRSSTGESTNTGTSQNSTTGLSSGTSQSDTNNSESSNGTSQSTNANEGTSETTSTGLSSLRITIPKTLRAALSSSNLGVSVSIPATTPTELPHGEWIIVDSQSEHWRLGVWVTELIEIFVP